MSDSPYRVTDVVHLLRSHAQLVGRVLLARRPGEPDADLADRLYRAPFVVLAHDAGPDPLFTYANLAGQRLFEREWDEFVGLPSRLSAEAPEQSERERFLARVRSDGFIDDYSGVRVTKSGHRFRILRATLWNVSDPEGRRIGQAATFAEWQDCDVTSRRP